MPPTIITARCNALGLAQCAFAYCALRAVRRRLLPSAQRLAADFHPALHLALRPAGELRKILRLLPKRRRQRCAILLARRAACFALPGMTQDVPALEIRAVAGLHEREIFGEGLCVVAYVQPGHIGGGAATVERAAIVAADPACAELDQLLVAQRLGRPRIAPAEIPGVFNEHRLHVLARNRAIEHGFVEVAEFVLHK